MDTELEKRLQALLDDIGSMAGEEYSLQAMDPVARMMMVTLLSESLRIEDDISGIGERIADRFLEDFVPRQNVGAVPAIVIVKPEFKQQKMSEVAVIDSNASFSFKLPAAKQAINYIPLFLTSILPLNEYSWMAGSMLNISGAERALTITKEQSNVLWLGLNSSVEIDSLKGLPILFKGTDGVAPVKISVGDTRRELSFASMNRMAEIEMVEPFDSQQSSGSMFSFIKDWKETLLDMQDNALIYITDPVKDRDLFKPKSYPSVFQFCLMSEDMDAIKDGTLWLKVEFPDQYVLPETCSVIVNAFPVVNVDVNQVILTQASPIAKLQKQEDAFFLGVLEQSNQSKRRGIDIDKDEYLIRDFDAACYHDGMLYRDVRWLYHHFVEDYYAFLGYNGIRDGELLRQLREAFNSIGKSVGAQNDKYKYDSGTYAMRNINYSTRSSSTKVEYMTTRGKIGNAPRVDDVLENRKHPALGKELRVAVSACCGRDKMSADERYEQFRYYAITGDRLYTKMDIDAFLRKEIVSEFGLSEFPRIDLRISVQGAGGDVALRRGLYIDILFKDKINYNKAVSVAFGVRMQQGIENKSCLSMPVIVKLVNLESQ